MKYFCFLFYLIFSIIFVSCNSDSSTNKSNIAPVDSSAFTYPFTNGSSWNYTHNITISNIRPDSIRHYFSQYPVNGSGIVTILYDTAINSITTKCFLETYNEFGSTYKSRIYFIKNDTSLMEYAYRLETGTGFVPSSKHQTAKRFIAGGWDFRNLEEQSIFMKYGIENFSSSDTLLINNPPLVSLKFPARTGMQWIVKIFSPSDTISKTYVGFVNAAVGNNTISCAKVQRKYSYIRDAVSTDYISKYGVTKKEFSIPNEAVTNEFGYVIGYIDWNETYQLTSYNIVNP